MNVIMSFPILKLSGPTKFVCFLFLYSPHRIINSLQNSPNNAAKKETFHLEKKKNRTIKFSKARQLINLKKQQTTRNKKKIQTDSE